MIDGRDKHFVVPSKKQINTLCNRQFGIGADGLIIVRKSRKADFEMLYYNADGNIGSMCGNGGRCAIAFAQYLGMIKNKTHFMAYDGLHEGEVLKNGVICLKLNDVKDIKKIGNNFELNTGSPHYVTFTKQVKELDVFKEGKKIRYHKRYAKQGINVNFVEINKQKLMVRTYERGVENETLSCGTGVTASAISYALLQKDKQKYKINVLTGGGQLSVRFSTNNHKEFNQIYLIGQAKQVFQGEINI